MVILSLDYVLFIAHGQCFSSNLLTGRITELLKSLFNNTPLKIDKNSIISCINYCESFHLHVY